jgi:PAS domain S-box-containing protein
VTFLNPAASRYLGWTWEDLVGKEMCTAIPFVDLTERELEGEELPCNVAIKERRPIPFEGHFVRRDRTRMRATGVAAPIVIESETHGAVVAFRDSSEAEKAATALAEAERELRHQRDLYEAGLEAIGDFGEGAMITSGSSLVWANDSVYDLLGYDEDALGKMDLLALVHEEDRARVRDDLRAQLLEGASARIHAARLMRGDGAAALVEIAVKLIDQGPPVTVFAIFRRG